MFKKDKVLAVNIGASTVTVAEFALTGPGGIELTTYAVKSLVMEEHAEEQERYDAITATLQEIMLEHQLSNAPALITVAGQSVFSRFVKLPPASKDKISQIVQYEAQQNVPFPMNEVVWDYQLIGGVDGDVDVMLAAIKADIIERLTEAVEAAGFSPDLVDVSPMAIYNCTRYNYDNLPDCTLVVDVGARSTDLIFIEQGRVFTRSIPVGGNTITQQIMKEFDLSFDDAEAMKKAQAYVAFGGAVEMAQSEVSEKVSKSVRTVMTRMHAEINRSINFYRTQQTGTKPALILLTGGSCTIPYTVEFLKEKLHIEVDYLNPFLNVPVHGQIDAAKIGDEAHYLADVVGVALRRVLTCPIEIDLLPPRVKAEKAFKKKEPILVGAAVGLVLIAAIWCSFFIKLSSLAEKQLEKIDGRVSALSAIEKKMIGVERDAADYQRRFTKLESLNNSESDWLLVLDDIHSRLPESLWITGLKAVEREAEEGGPIEVTPLSRVWEKYGAIDVTGMAYLDVHSATDIRALRDEMRSSAFFTDESDIMKSPSPNLNDAVMEFEIRLVLNKDVEL